MAAQQGGVGGRRTAERREKQGEQTCWLFIANALDLALFLDFGFCIFNAACELLSAPVCVCTYVSVCAGTLAEFPVVNIRQLRVLQNYFSQLFSWQRCHTQIAYIAPSLSFSLSLSCALCLSCQKHTAKQVPALSPGQALPQVPLTGHKHVQININSGQEQKRGRRREAGEHGLGRGWCVCLFTLKFLRITWNWDTDAAAGSPAQLASDHAVNCAALSTCFEHITFTYENYL